MGAIGSLYMWQHGGFFFQEIIDGGIKDYWTRNTEKLKENGMSVEQLKEEQGCIVQLDGIEKSGSIYNAGLVQK